MSLDVNVLAELSFLRVPEDQMETVEQELSALLQVMDRLPLDIQLDEMDADKNNPMELREDVVGESLTREQVLSNAPQKQAGCFVVPRTV